MGFCFCLLFCFHNLRKERKKETQLKRRLVFLIVRENKGERENGKKGSTFFHTEFGVFEPNRILPVGFCASGSQMFHLFLGCVCVCVCVCLFVCLFVSVLRNGKFLSSLKVFKKKNCGKIFSVCKVCRHFDYAISSDGPPP